MWATSPKGYEDEIFVNHNSDKLYSTTAKQAEVDPQTEGWSNYEGDSNPQYYSCVAQACIGSKEYDVSIALDSLAQLAQLLRSYKKLGDVNYIKQKFKSLEYYEKRFADYASLGTPEEIAAAFDACERVVEKFRDEGAEWDFKVGDKVLKHTGDYNIEGTVVGRFKMTSGAKRYCVEHQAVPKGSFVHIYAASNIRIVE